MNDYYEVRVDIDPCTDDTADLLAAMLGDIEYETFVPDDKGLTAYVKSELYKRALLEDVLSDFPMPCRLTFSATLVPGQDWNSEWEKNYFQPILVGEGERSVAIHSSFHTDIPKAEYDIVIDPKMAFGTGHHATTSSIIEQLLLIDLQGRAVIDMGTGTGILAILAAMRGASPVTGIEIDGFAYENALDNVKVNGHPEIKLIHGDASALHGVGEADVFIANINRNVITADLDKYAAKLKSGGAMLLSGFYESDIPVVMAVAAPLGLVEKGHTVKGDNWCCLRLQKE